MRVRLGLVEVRLGQVGVRLGSNWVSSSLGTLKRVNRRQTTQTRTHMEDKVKLSILFSRNPKGRKLRDG